MTIIQNLSINPTFESTIGGGGWSTNRATFERSNEWSASGDWSAKVIGQSTNSYIQGDMRVGAASVFPAEMVPGRTYTISATMHTPVPHIGFNTATNSRQRRIIAGPSSDSNSYSLVYGEQAPNDDGEHRVSVTITLPLDTTGVVILLGAAGSLDDPDFVTYWDAVMITEGTYSSPYRDGNSPGWEWDGVPNASSSRGPAEPYSPDARLFRDGQHLAWVDLLDGFEESTNTGSTVEVAPLGGASRITVRPAPGGTGTMTAHFVRELADGTPGDRAKALYAALGTGAPIELRFEHTEPGLNTLNIVPTGAVTRTLQRGSRTVWTVAAEFTVVAP